MSDASIQDLLAARQVARDARDFARADELRDKILDAGYLVRDTADGQVLERPARFSAVDPASIASQFHEPASTDFSLHILHEGHVDDLERFLSGFEKHNDITSTEVVIVDNASTEGAEIEDVVAGRAYARVVHLDRELGWAAARNAGLRDSRGAIVCVVDLSIEPTGDILSPVRDALSAEGVGLAGPFGLRSDDMRTWVDSSGPEVDAIEGYFMAVRREALPPALLFEKFKWYRNADIDFSFEIRSGGWKAVVVPLPVEKRTHRGWAALDEDERAKRSKRNHYIFFDRWKSREDLLLARRG